MRRTPIPPSATGWVVLAAAAIPFAIKVAKPLARKIARGLQNFGEKLEEAAAESGGPSAPEPPDKQNATMKNGAPTEHNEEAPAKPKRTKATPTRDKPKAAAKPRAKKVDMAKSKRLPDDIDTA